MAAGPTQALRGETFRLGVDAHQRRIARAMRLAEGMPARRQRDGVGIIHAHAGKGLADIAARGDRIGVAVRPLGVDVDQAHLHGGQRVLKLPVAGIALIGQPFGLGAPVDILLGLPHIDAAAREAMRLAAHAFDRDIAGQHHQIGPGQRLPVFLLDRPEQAARLVEVDVIGPGIERCEALRTGGRPAAPIRRAIGARTVPGHADEERPVMAVIGGPPVLAVGHQRVQIGDDRIEVEALERLRIVERFAKRVRRRLMLVQDLEVELIGPPLPRCAAGICRMDHRAFAHVVAVHVSVLPGYWLICLCPLHSGFSREG